MGRIRPSLQIALLKWRKELAAAEGGAGGDAAKIKDRLVSVHVQYNGDAAGIAEAGLLIGFFLPGGSGADVVMILRIQRERQDAAYFPTLREYSIHYGLTNDRLDLAKKDAIVLHPGPMNRGIEIASEVADSSRSLILDQVKYGVAVRMAVLYLATGGAVVNS